MGGGAAAAPSEPRTQARGKPAADCASPWACAAGSYNPPMSRKQIPNAITLLRLVIAVAFFVVMQDYRFASDSPLWLLPLAVGLFITAAVTDAIDGYLARKWQAESRFGRIMDPFCDKVLVIGAFLYLASARFADQTGVAPWMVVAVLARELLVTGIRDEMESAGVKFGANWSGKAKMVVQSVAVPTLLAIVWWRGGNVSFLPDCPAWMAQVRDGLVWLTVGITVLSGWPYVWAAIRGIGTK